MATGEEEMDPMKKNHLKPLKWKPVANAVIQMLLEQAI